MTSERDHSDRVAVIGAGLTPLAGELLSVDLDVVADVCELRLADTVDAWHDWAVFHFLVEPADQQAYVASVRSTLAVGGTS